MNKEITTRTRKVLFVITKSNWGGAQKYVYELAHAFAQNPSYDIAVAFGGDGVLAKKLEEAGVRLHPLKTLSNDFSVINLFSNIIELHTVIKTEQPDIIHVNSSKAGLLGALTGRLSGVGKVIFTSHAWPFNEDRNMLVRALLWSVMALTVLLSHSVIAVSKKIERETPLYSFFRKKINQIYFGIPLLETLGRATAREKLHIETVAGRIDIVTIAELNSNKGYTYALSAMRNLIFNEKQNIHYHIIGEGVDHQKITSLIKKFHLEPYITMHGFIQDASIYLRAFDVFLLTSITEALGFVLLEAGHAGLPVVATAVGGIPEVITHNKTGLLAKTKDSKSIKEQLLLLTEDLALREKLGSALKEEADHTFNLSVTIEKTEALYTHLCK